LSKERPDHRVEAHDVRRETDFSCDGTRGHALAATGRTVKKELVPPSHVMLVQAGALMPLPNDSPKERILFGPERDIP
jgi:hypothetical protein